MNPNLRKKIKKAHKLFHKLEQDLEFYSCLGVKGFSFHYCGDDLYLIRNDQTNAIAAVYGTDPDNAAWKLYFRK